MTTRERRRRWILAWAGCALLLGISLAWLGVTLLRQDEAHVPVAFGAVALAAVTAVSVWGGSLLAGDVRRTPKVGPAVWEELRQPLRAMPKLPESRRLETLLDGLVLASQPVKLGPVRLRDIIQECVRRSATPVLVHEGGDPHVLGDAQALSYALDALLQGRSGARIELRTEGRLAEITIRGEPATAASFAVVRQVIEAQGGELLTGENAPRIRLPLTTVS